MWIICIFVAMAGGWITGTGINLLHDDEEGGFPLLFIGVMLIVAGMSLAVALA